MIGNSLFIIGSIFFIPGMMDYFGCLFFILGCMCILISMIMVYHETSLSRKIPKNCFPDS